MKVNFDRVMRDPLGNPFSDYDQAGRPTGRPMTLRFLAVEALGSESQERRISREEKLRRHALAVRIATGEGEEVDVSDTEVSLILELIGEFFRPHVYGAAFENFKPIT